jgi:hypothetical protein
MRERFVGCPIGENVVKVLDMWLIRSPERKQRMKKVKIYPAFDALYYSFYIQGIVNIFGESNVEFSYDGFPRLPFDCLAFIVPGNPELRIVIDAYDGAKLTDYTPIEWCDVYGKVNLISSLIPEQYLYKCLPIGPSFPIQIWSWGRTSWMALKHYRPTVQGLRSARQHLANYVRQCRDRLPLRHFVPGSARDNYIFFSSSIWSEDEAPETNRHRALFIETCRSLKNVTFEGGFSPRPSGPYAAYAARYKKYITTRRFSLPEWLENTQFSSLVFYTPAVWLSHTWKLAEFLALGKAIISTSISRELPAPLVHREQIHYVDGSPESLAEAINLILTNRDYRTYLERNAYRYYAAFLTPERVIQRVLQHHGDNRPASAPSESRARNRQGVARPNTLTALSPPVLLSQRKPRTRLICSVVGARRRFINISHP